MGEGLTVRKARGAFFTPPEITRFISDWAVRTPADAVLEPSCGEAAFLLAAGRRLSELGGAGAARLHGIEIHEPSAERGRTALRRAGFNAAIGVCDFFDYPPTPGFDAVVGNPPYIRYQQFRGEARGKSLEAALAGGVRLTGLASSWAAFVIHASQFLKPEGRLGLVLPAELLSVNYAAEVRRFLLRRFSRVRLVMFDTRVFPDVLEEVVLLLAEGSGGAASFEVFQARDLAELTRLDTHAWTGFDLGAIDKWTPALLSQASFGVYQALCRQGAFSPLLGWGETYLGAVTGANGFFAVTEAEAVARRLPRQDLLPISPPGARHLSGLSFSPAQWQALRDGGGRCWLFYPHAATPGAAARRLIAQGERDKVDLAYKCRVRKPWWRVPLVARPDLILTYMNHDRPRLVSNAADVHIINSVYGVTLHPALREAGRVLLPLAALNSVTLLGAEMVGRAYGGGLLKLEPREADTLPVPPPDALATLAPQLEALRAPVLAALGRGETARAVDLVDEVVLSRPLGLGPDELRVLREARAFLFARRVGRGRMLPAARDESHGPD
ncbi:MAG: N-6 DNA methylase [Rhodospirillaceae bacterium]